MEHPAAQAGASASLHFVLEPGEMIQSGGSAPSAALPAPPTHTRSRRSRRYGLATRRPVALVIVDESSKPAREEVRCANYPQLAAPAPTQPGEDTRTLAPGQTRPRRAGA